MREIAGVDGVLALIVAGYSLGGNLAEAPGLRQGAARRSARSASSPVMARACVRIEHTQNVVYQWNFVRG